MPLPVTLMLMCLLFAFGLPVPWLCHVNCAPARVQDILKVVRAVVDRADAQQHRVYNMGRLATLLCLQLGYRL